MSRNNPRPLRGWATGIPGAARGPWPARWSESSLFALAAMLAGALILVAPKFAEAAGSRPHVSIPGGLRGQTCYACHIRGDGIVTRSQERPQKYSIAWAFLTYRYSPHGRMRAMGATGAPNCEDCHLTREWTNILPREHPDSPINPANLPRICAKCHGPGMLTANVAKGSMHLALGTRSLRLGKPLDVRYGFLPGITKLESSYYIGNIDVLAYVYYLFLVLTVGTLCVMATYMVLDLIRKLAERRHRIPEPGHEE